MKSYDIVDFHSHILPGADHGSTCLETSVAQLSLARDAGVTRIIATPHFYPHRHTLDTFLERRKLAFENLRDAGALDICDVRVGAEVLICENIELLEGIEELCIEGTRTLLLELPFLSFSESYCNTVEALILQGYEIVLAHADRYPKENIERLLSCGAKIQLNADSIATLFKKKHLYNWAENGHVVAIGSDIHNADGSAYKKFVRAQNKFLPYLDNIKKASDAIWDKASEKRMIKF